VEGYSLESLKYFREQFSAMWKICNYANDQRTVALGCTFRICKTSRYTLAVLVFVRYRSKVTAENDNHKEGKIYTIRKFLNKTLGILNAEPPFLRHPTRNNVTVLNE
jgi:hypothetical protein